MRGAIPFKISNKNFARIFIKTTFEKVHSILGTVRPATALFLVPGIYSAIENSANGGSCYLVSCKFLQKIVL